MSPGSQATLIPRLLQAEPPDTYMPVNWTPEFYEHSLTFERMTFKSQARLNLSDLSTENCKISRRVTTTRQHHCSWHASLDRFKTPSQSPTCSSFTTDPLLQQTHRPYVFVQVSQLSGTLSVQLPLDLDLQSLIGCFQVMDLKRTNESRKESSHPKWPATLFYWKGWVNKLKCFNQIQDQLAVWRIGANIDDSSVEPSV